jgi:hypothetical protein
MGPIANELDGMPVAMPNQWFSRDKKAYTAYIIKWAGRKALIAKHRE